MKYRYPFTPFPTGWYRIESRGKNVYAFGKLLALKTTFDNKTILIEEKNPQQILPVVHKNDAMFAFYSSIAQAPYFEVPTLEEFNHPEWQRPFYLSWRSTKVHAQEIAENALDLSHFCVVHTYHTIPVISKFHIYGHQFTVLMHSQKKVFGMNSETEMEITYHGIGIVVANVKSANNIQLKVFLTTTPIDQYRVDIHMAVAIRKTNNLFKNLLLRAVLPKEIRTEFSRDIPVWEAKIYRSKPLLCQSEANIVRIRKWAQQFYSDASNEN